MGRRTSCPFREPGDDEVVSLPTPFAIGSHLLGERRHCLLKAREALHCPSHHGAALWKGETVSGVWLSICVRMPRARHHCRPYADIPALNSLFESCAYWLSAPINEGNSNAAVVFRSTKPYSVGSSFPTATARLPLSIFHTRLCRRAGIGFRGLYSLFAPYQRERDRIPELSHAHCGNPRQLS